MKIVLLHPDLGIGGAERLVVDVAMALKLKGHAVQFLTPHHDPSHCFTETKDGTLDVTVVGNWLPRSIFSRFHAACAYFRMIYAAFFLIFFSDLQPDLIFCDQVSACIPVLKLKKTKVIFYCHFPDQLLSKKTNWLKRLYRLPLDWFEEKTTGMADIVLVNSEFTASVFRNTFESLKCIELKVLHPSIKFESLQKRLSGVELGIKTTATTIFLSINRFERKKNLDLAIFALKKLKEELPLSDASKIHVIIAGGYDERVVENKEHFLELVELAEICDVSNQITFLKSPSDDKKQMLFHSCTAVLYTPQNEHFGIVPLEAMFLSRPVIACNSGGPLETILHEETGYLCDPTPEAFAEKMKFLARDRSLSRELGYNGSEHVRKKFSYKAFSEKLNDIVQQFA